MALNVPPIRFPGDDLDDAAQKIVNAVRNAA